MIRMFALLCILILISTWNGWNSLVMTSHDEVQEVATSSGALEGPGKVNVWNPTTLALCQLPLTPELKLVIAHFLLRFSGGHSGRFLISIYTTGNYHQNRKIKQIKNQKSNHPWLLHCVWSDLSVWGHFLIVLNLRNLNLRSTTECGNANLDPF